MNCPDCNHEIDLHKHDAEQFRKGWEAGNKAGLEVRKPLVDALTEAREHCSWSGEIIIDDALAKVKE